MKAVIQRVDFAKVLINSREISSISRGLLVFLGIEKGDRVDDADYLVEKILQLRIFEDSKHKMNLSLIDIGGELLAVSQFTLLADCRKGRRPSFTNAEEPVKAKQLYEYFIEKATGFVQTAAGEFQAHMKIESINNGPVTISIESKKNE
jgi:D-tyrosyl-tRNA(Tyr) deacylase